MTPLTARRRCTSPANGHVNVARLLLDKGAEVDRAKEDGRTPPTSPARRPRRRGAAAAGQRRGGRSGDDGGRSTPLFIACRRHVVDVGAAAAGQRRGGRSGDKWELRRRCTSPAERPRRRGAAAAGQRRGGRSGDEGRRDAAVRRLPCGRVDAARLLLEKGAEVDRARRTAATSGRHGPLGTQMLEDGAMGCIACQNGHVDAGGCCWRKARRSTAGRTQRRCHRGCQSATSTWRSCCWRKARRSIRAEERHDAAVSSPAGTDASTRRGCCWRKARRSTGRIIGRPRRRRWTQQSIAVRTQSSRSSRTTFTRQTSDAMLDKGAAKIWRT